MRGSVEKRGDRVYRIKIHLGYSADGKRQTHSETCHGTAAEAERRKRDLIAEFERGSLVARSRKPYSEFLKDWLETKSSQVRVRTAEDYAELIERYLKKTLGKLPLDKLTPLGIQKVYNDLVGKGLSGQTIRRLHTVVNQSLKQAVQWRMLPHNPAMDVQLPRLSRKKVAKPLALEQVLAFMKASEAHRCGAPLRFFVETGCRPQEIAALLWPDIDQQTKRAAITKAMTWPKGGGAVVQETKTESSRRQVSLSDTCLADLKKHRIEQLEHRMKLGSEWQGTEELVFCNFYGKPISLNLLRLAFRDVLEAAGLPMDFRPYDLRHTHATLLLGLRVPSKVTSERLGHSTIVLTLNTYSHVDSTMQEEAVSQFENLVHLGNRSGTKATGQTAKEQG